MANKLICVTGMPGSGKSEATTYLLTKKSFGYFRFGQIVLDKITALGREPSPSLEREIRESLREEYGMAVMAILNEPKINELLEKESAIGDGLRSFEEYLYLKRKFSENLIVIAVYSSPMARYQRLKSVSQAGDEDFGTSTYEEAVAHDVAEIERLNLGGTLAMADFMVVNDGDKDKLFTQLDNIYQSIYPM